jgi:putative membrane protein
MTTLQSSKFNDRIFVPLIWTLSIAIPVVVAILMTPGLIPNIELGFDPFILSKLNAGINSVVSVLLVLGFVFIKQRKIPQHRAMMLTAFGLSAFFLISYVLYHLAVGHVKYCDEGLLPSGIYYVILLTHVVLSAAIVPLASFSVYRGLSERYDKHRKIARITFPIWLYVSVTGVLVYFLIAPCQPV